MRKMHNENDIACAIFAGGQNRRMGQHKAFLDHYGRKFIEVIRDNMSEWFEDVFVVTNDRTLFPDMLQEQVFEDIIPGKGPLGALHTALTVTKREKVFCVACDMPFSPVPVMSKIISISGKNSFDCVVPVGVRGAEPLFAVYRRTIRDLIEREIESGRLRFSGILEKCRTCYVDAKKRDEKLLNVNTPEDYLRYAGKIEDMA